VSIPRQAERTFGLVTAALSKYEPGGLPSVGDAAARRDALARTSGALTGAYGKDYLAGLRTDWPE
jgi:hypothetical protein